VANTGILNHKFLYIAHGYGDKTEERFRLSSKKMESLLLKKNIPGLRWVFKSMDNDDHGQTPMEGIYKGLVAFNRQLTLNDAQIETFFKVTNKPFIESVKDYYRLASEWSGIKLPYLRDINLHGYNLLYDKRPKESKELFTWGLSIYPHNLNLYDSMGEIQQESGDKAAALKYYTAGLNEIKNQKQTLESKRYDQLIAAFEKRITSLDK
jgi:tetratricopeptide (TPR) repeat protein